MKTRINPIFLLYLFVCLTLMFSKPSAAQNVAYTFETIDVEGVDFLALTASSDFDDYAGYTKSPDGEKEIGFTLIDDVFTTYDYPGSQNTYFYALGNDGRAAGHYQDSDGLHHGVILENGELRRYDFPDAVQTEIYGISDATGVLTGSWIDAEGVRRGFSGDRIIEVPGAMATFADFTTGTGAVAGVYIDSAGVYKGYVHAPDGRFIFGDVLETSRGDWFFIHGITDFGVFVVRAQVEGDVPRTYVGRFGQLGELQYPDSVSTEGWNINRDNSVVGHYESADGRTHGFIARPASHTPPPPVVVPTGFAFETIAVAGVDFLELTASSDFGDYAGNTLSADGEKIVGFTLIDGVFQTYDYPGSQNTYFYALGNDGRAAGYYQDSDGLHHGVILENGELRQYDFPGSVQTEIFGISDATGALTGNFIDDVGVRRGFSGETIVEVPGAVATYADFVSGSGAIVGSFINSDGVYKGYGRAPDGRFAFVDVVEGSAVDWLFIHGINDVGVFVVRAQVAGDVPRTYVGRYGQLGELQFPESVSTEGYNINQDGSVVGYYDTADGQRHGFIARPTAPTEPDDVPKPDDLGDGFNVTLAKGLNMISVPLAPPKPMNARALAALTGATTVITLDTAHQQFVGYTPDAPDDGFLIEGGQGYIVNVPETREVTFVGSAWTNESAAAAPAIAAQPSAHGWAFVVSGHLAGTSTYDGYHVIVRNPSTDSTITAAVRGRYFAAATADLSRQNVVEVGDVVHVQVIGPDGNVESDTFRYSVTPESIENAVLSIRLDRIGQPRQTQLLQNFPNPFNPETWIPYHLSTDADVKLTIYDTQGVVVRQLDLGHQLAGYYTDGTKAAYWDGRNALGEGVASGVYFYHLSAGDYSATRRMLILK